MLMTPKRTYPLSIAREYVSGWTMRDAVRELIQNAIDSPAPFRYEFARQSNDLSELLLASEGVTLAPETLLLGASSKGHDPDAIGSFGEGYKLAMLVLLRNGYRFSILNGDVEWRPRFQFSRQFARDMLVVEEFALSDRMNNGLVFRVSDLTPADEAAIRDLCLRMQDDIGETRRTERGDILLERPGKLYVGSLYVCETELDYGYDVLPKFMRLERDRKTVDGWDLKCATRDMWYATKDYATIADLIGKNCPDLAYGQYEMPDMVKEACYQHFRERHPADVIAKTDEELKALVKQGMTVYSTVSGAYYHGVSQSAAYQAEPRVQAIKPEELPVNVLEKWLSANRKNMRGAAVEAFRKELIRGAAIEWRAKR